ncbi:hypothetical protein [Streptococcus dentiloxodontae]
MKKVLTLGLLSLSLLTIAACSNQSKSGSASNASASSSQKQKISYDDKGLPTVLKTSYTGSATNEADKNGDYGNLLFHGEGGADRTITFDKENLTVNDDPDSSIVYPFKVISKDDLNSDDKARFKKYESETKGKPYFIMLTVYSGDDTYDEKYFEEYKESKSGSSNTVYIAILSNDGKKLNLIELDNDLNGTYYSLLNFTGEAD